MLAFSGRAVAALPAQAIIAQAIEGPAPFAPGNDAVLKDRLRHELVKQAHRRFPTTYVRLTRAVAPSSIGEAAMLASALEQTMEEDAGEDHPLVAALVVNLGTGLPAPWFFRKARVLGKFAGQPDDVEAFAFHASELQRAISYCCPQLSASMETARTTTCGRMAAREGERHA
jgi:hypothetical protein